MIFSSKEKTLTEEEIDIADTAIREGLKENLTRPYDNILISRKKIDIVKVSLLCAWRFDVTLSQHLYTGNPM